MESPRGTPANQENCDKVLLALRKIIHAIDQYSRILIQKHGVTFQQLVLLRELARHGEMSVGQLAKRAHLSQATVTGILDRLERKSLLERERSESDKRRVMVKSTHEARLLLERTPPPFQDMFMARFAELEEWEQTLLVSAVQRVAFMMTADHGSLSPAFAGELSSPGPTEEPLDMVEG